VGTRRMTDQEFEEFRSTRREAGKDIDPANVEVKWIYAQTVDPYGLDPELPVECQQVGREYFVRSPGSDIWVWFGDLPSAMRDTLWERHKQKLGFPAGLPPLPKSH
jgi:hypothetical protein